MAAEEAADAGDLPTAEQLFKDSLARERPAGDDLDFVLGCYGRFLFRLNRLDAAASALEEAMERGTDIPATWTCYLDILARRRAISDMVEFYDRLPTAIKGGLGLAGWLLHYAHTGPVDDQADAEFYEHLAATVRDECVKRRDQEGEWAAIGVHGQLLERNDKIDEAIAEWQVAFETGSKDAKTADRLSLSLDRAKCFSEAAAVCKAALERGLPASTEDVLRKRLERLERKLTTGATKKRDVPAFSVRSGEGYATLVLQHRLSPPLRDLAIHEQTAYCLGYAKETGIITRVHLGSGETERTEALPPMDEMRLSPSGWGIGLQRRGRVGDGSAILTFLTPTCGVYAEAELPAAASEISYGANRWFIGCRNGRLYAYDLGGVLLWEWVTPGSDTYDGSPYFRPCPYFVAATDRFVTLASMGRIFSVGFDGRQLWDKEVPQQEPFTFTKLLGSPHGSDTAWSILQIQPGATDEEIKRAYHEQVFATHPDQNPDDLHAAERFRQVQRSYEEIAAGARTIPSTHAVTFTISSPAIVRGLVSAGDTILASSADGVLSRMDAAGHVQGRRVLGRGDVRIALRPDGSLAATYCDGTLSFFEGDAIVNVAEVADEYPTTMIPWQDDILFIQGGSVKVFDQSGRAVWGIDFPKRVVSASVNNRFLVFGAGALEVFERSAP